MIFDIIIPKFLKYEPKNCMRLSPVELEKYKTTLIIEHVLPVFGDCGKDKELIAGRIAGMCRLQKAVKCQQLEVPGSHEMGSLWLSVHAIVHSYFYDNERDCKVGNRIWKKREFIFDAPSLFSGEERSDYVEILEPGEVLYIPYPELITLMQEFDVLEKYLRHLSGKTEHYYRHHNHLINKPPLQRVKEFEQENALFASIASNSLKASHVGLTRQGYELQLKKLGRKY